ncbi:hypothetical protein DITRI_Ditri08aG0107900 [Diplodiscus trichospermus]
MAVTTFHGHLLEVTVVRCNKLKDTELISRQDPYVCLEYGSGKYRTRTCTDGGKTPTFQEKFTLTLIEGLREINVAVWSTNTLTVQLQKLLSQGYDDTPWSLQTKTGRYAGEVRLIMQYGKAKHPATTYAPSAPPYAAPPPQVPLYSAPPPTISASYPPPATTYPAPSSYPSSTYPPPPATYPHPPPPPSAYPSPPLLSAYPPATYPPASPYYSPGPFPGLYPPPPPPYSCPHRGDVPTFRTLRDSHLRGC